MKAHLHRPLHRGRTSEEDEDEDEERVVNAFSNCSGGAGIFTGEYMFTMEYLADTDAIPSRYRYYTLMIPLLILM